MKKKVGLYFGTFNPIHVGHCIIAQYMLEFTDLEEVWFVVTPHNPHKKKSSLLDDRQRLHMVNLAIGDHYKLRVSDVEFGLPQPSYTANTLVHLEENHPEFSFHLIMGEDNLESFPRWRNFESILEQHELYVYPRIASDGGELAHHPKVHITKSPIIEIASTEIREAIKEGKDVSYMLPPAVWNYIDQELFYRD
ncbi:nicotinate (nicotinamide) nucleotide adenylyltransferase [Croceimicrobium hydrocarbonivorans]|uniref:Probable nicotinate-nucleotide adenylyltransferase n=1 Tax=Croceimicrobium hydrocarbonivorans TaxID=2761580 RepID=A0A7H0VIY5_9FLAO|nr:nicotinate (nicotinamide) nucleotide adenylyltransferase [Croceimicrobium hydrocarbonivorans]QNR25683.1 nicotinate-nucleotide adenylyltransferase [Croceimicrobium hydrocarbonivorans]